MEERKYLFGDFKDAFNYLGQIQLKPNEREYVKDQIRLIKKRFRFSLPSLIRGVLIATEYAGRVRNYSTRTSIITLDNGKKIFAVYCYPLSGIHRFFDKIAKYFSGDRMAKALSRE